MEQMRSNNKIGIVGIGEVGASLAFALVMSGPQKDIVLLDVNNDRALGQAMDMSHAASLIRPITVRAGSYEDLHDAQIIVITAGTPRKSGETRLNVAERNATIVKEIIKEITHVNNSAILIMVTNPVDVLTYIALKSSGFPSSRVIGSGTLLDSARFRTLLSNRCAIDARSIHAYVIGEHGDSEVPVWSSAIIGGTGISNFCFRCIHPCSVEERQEISNKVKGAGSEIIKYKGSTSYGIAISVLRIIEAILRDGNSVLSVSTLLKDYHGISDVTVSVPCVVNGAGVVRTIDINLSDEELAAFLKSAGIVRETAEKLI